MNTIYNSEKLNWENNSIDLIKMIAAFSVAAVHWTKIGMVENPDRMMIILRQFFLGVPSVVMFFVISGYLAAVSVDKYTIREYIYNRFIRIYPPLWISAIFNILVLLILWNKRIDGSFFIGVLAEFLGIAYTPACLKSLPTGSMAGALWTVMVQIQFYLFICIINPCLKKLNFKRWGIILIMALGINIFFGILPQNFVLSKVAERLLFPYLVWFLFGVFAFNYKDKVIPICKRMCYPCLCLMLIYIGVERPLKEIGYYADVIITLCTLPMTIGLIYMFGKIRIKNEFSFSVFLYHWTVLNVFAILGMYQFLGTLQGLIIYIFVVMIVSYYMNKVSIAVCRRINIV